jgi:paraquat-inducible protein A
MGRMQRALPIILFGATLCFALGVTLPLIEVERLFLFSEEPSLVAMVAGLWAGGDFALALLIALFSVLFPALKLALLHADAYGGPAGADRLPTWVHALARWSMLDVVLVAIVVFAAKTTGLATVLVRPGLWFFAGSVLLTAAASALLDWAAKQAPPQKP